MWIERARQIFALVRDIILFGGGLVFAYNEIIVASAADPQVLILVAAMLGLGLIFRA